VHLDKSGKVMVDASAAIAWRRFINESYAILPPFKACALQPS
jgi:hypothetical protein